MQTSENLSDLTAALAKAQGELSAALKTSDNPFYQSKYADLATVWECWQKVGPKNGLAITQVIRAADGGLVLDTVLLHVSGQRVVSTIPIRPMRQTKDKGWVESPDPQSMGSAITYSRRQALQAISGIVADLDDDAEGAVSEGKKTRPTQAISVTAMEDWIAGFLNQLNACKSDNAVLDLQVVNEKGLAKLKMVSPSRHADVSAMIQQSLENLNVLQAG